MNLEKRIEAFAALGTYLSKEIDEDMEAAINLAQVKNPWFTSESSKRAFSAWAKVLTKERLEKWTSKYKLAPIASKRVGIIMAGNIPLVGFHDLISVVLSGHQCIVKMSTQDEVLMMRIIEILFEQTPELRDEIKIVSQLKEVDAVIATGSDNSSRYFEYYFGKYPNIIRKNRTSVAIITGTETEQELRDLGKDVFSYFGLGCRNVSKIFFPEGYDVKNLLDLWNEYAEILDHNKYRNNYDYHKSILLVNKEAHLDTGFSLWRETNELVSPLSVIHYEHYRDVDQLMVSLSTKEEKIQCKVSVIKSDDCIQPGTTQQPELWDYADGVDTLSFLDSL
jgi:hypothetical protein